MDEIRKIPCVEEAINKALEEAERQKAIAEGRLDATT